MSPASTEPATIGLHRALLVCLGDRVDVLLATAVASSLRAAFSDVQIDWLVTPEASPVLDASPVADHVLTVRRARSRVRAARAGMRLAARIARRYDLALVLGADPRSHRYAVLAAPERAVLAADAGESGDAVLAQSDQRHRLQAQAAMLRQLGIESRTALALPRAEPQPHRRPYVVLADAAEPWRAWPRSAWQACANLVEAAGLEVVTLAPAAPLDMRALVAAVAPAHAVVATDPLTAHLAAALGVRLLHPIGPDSPVHRGPWPVSAGQQRQTSPWHPDGGTQKHGNVWLIQSSGYCVPCGRRGCLDASDSPSACLDWLPAARVMRLLEPWLASARRVAGGGESSRR